MNTKIGNKKLLLIVVVVIFAILLMGTILLSKKAKNASPTLNNEVQNEQNAVDDAQIAPSPTLLPLEQ